MTDEPGSVADLIRTAAEAAIEFRSGLADRPVARPVDREALRTALGGPLPTGAHCARPGTGPARCCRGPRAGRHGGSPLLRVRRRRLAAGGHRRGHPRDRLGPAGVQRTCSRRPRARSRRWPAAGSRSCSACRRRRRSDSCTGAQSANTVGLAAGRHQVLAGRRVGRRARRAGRLAAGPGGRLRGAARHRGPVAAAARPGRRERRAGRRGRQGRDRHRRPGQGSRRRAGRADDPRACRRATSTPAPATTCGRRSASPAASATAGCTSTARSGCGPPPARTPGTWSDGVELADSWGTRRAQVAQRPLRLRVRVLRATGRRTSRPPSLHRRVPGRAREPTQSPSDFVLESSRRARGFAVWAALRELGATAWPTWSTAAAGWPAGSPTGWPPAGSRSSTTWCSTRCWRVRCRRDRTDAVVDGGAAGGHLLAGRHHLARPAADAGVGVELVDHRGRRRPLGGGDPADRRRRMSGGGPRRRAERQILRLAVPALGALLAEPMFLLVDAAIVGHLGVAQLAGVGIASVILGTHPGRGHPVPLVLQGHRGRGPGARVRGERVPHLRSPGHRRCRRRAQCTVATAAVSAEVFATEVYPDLDPVTLTLIRYPRSAAVASVLRGGGAADRGRGPGRGHPVPLVLQGHRCRAPRARVRGQGVAHLRRPGHRRRESVNVPSGVTAVLGAEECSIPAVLVAVTVKV